MVEKLGVKQKQWSHLIFFLFFEKKMFFKKVFFTTEIEEILKVLGVDELLMASGRGND
jgi:hypothetical protein